jgi:hypothetical protein
MISVQCSVFSYVNLDREPSQISNWPLLTISWGEDRPRAKLNTEN